MIFMKLPEKNLENHVLKSHLNVLERYVKEAISYQLSSDRFSEQSLDKTFLARKNFYDHLGLFNQYLLSIGVDKRKFEILYGTRKYDWTHSRYLDEVVLCLADLQE